MATPFLEGFPLISKLINQTPRLDLIAKASEKIIKSAKRNDLLRIIAGFADIANTIIRPVEDIYLGRSIVVALTNASETLEEVLKLKNASYKNLLDGPRRAIDLIEKAFTDLSKKQGKIDLKSQEDIQWLRDSGIFGIASFTAGITSFLGKVIKNKPLAIGGRFIQTYTSDGDKFLSNNSDRNYSGFGFTLENMFDNIVRFTKGKVPEKITKILIAGQYAISWTSRTLAARSQAAAHKENLPKIYENPLLYARQASAALFKALNPFDTVGSSRSEFLQDVKINPYA
ncbi:MAG: hypothetical protein ACKO3R_00345 [bacterium]